MKISIRNMKHGIATLCLLSILVVANAQKGTFDLATYTQPKGWAKQATKETLQLTKEDAATGAYCFITLYKALPGDEDPKSNFTMSWEALVKETLGVLNVPEMQAPVSDDGWVAESGYATFEKEGASGIALLVTTSGYGKMVNILILTNSDVYETAVTGFLASIDLKKPTVVSTNTTKTNPDITTPSTPRKSKFKFTTTNFDDGWTATEQEDWVEVTKGNIKVLLHYPTDKINAANTDVDVTCAAAWNVLVSPRYSNIQNYKITPGVLDYERPYYAQAELTENATGKNVFVALFRKANSGWIEFICPDINSFNQQFGFDVAKVDYYADSKIWEPMKKMADYNKFAIAASDLAGKWTNNFAANTYYANVYTGASAGMSTYSSSQDYEFFQGNKYKWRLVAANSYGGASNFSQGKGAGTFKVVNNWQLYFSNMEGKPKTYYAQFSCVKGGRILWVEHTSFARVE
jgi:hypothetical protein